MGQEKRTLTTNLDFQHFVIAVSRDFTSKETGETKKSTQKSQTRTNKQKQTNTKWLGKKNDSKISTGTLFQFQ